MGVDHDTEGSKPGATVTPIRPEVQLGDTTPFGITPPGPTPPSAEDEDTWGSSPRRRMQAGEPTDHPVRLTANDRNHEVDAATGAGPIGPSADGPHADDELDSTRRLVRQIRSHAPSSWRAAPALALIALLGAAVALMNAGAPVARPRAATSNISATGDQPSAALPSLPNQLTARSTVRRHHTTKTNRRSGASHAGRQHRRGITRHRPTRTRRSSTVNESHSSQSSPASHITPVSSPAQPAQTPTSTSPPGSGGQATTRPPTSTPPTAPAGPTGTSALIGPGHCGC